MSRKPEANPKNLHQAERLLALIALACIIVLNLFFFKHRGGFWRDEVDLINLSADNPLKSVGTDSFPVLMSAIVHYWMQIAGAHDRALRCLGLIIGLAGTIMLWIAGKSLRQAPPIFGLILFALNSTVIAYDQALRGYGLGGALIIGYVLAMWTFLRGDSPARFIMLLLLAVLSVQTLFQNAVLIAAISVGAWAVCLRHNLRAQAIKILIVGLAAAASLKPYVAGIQSVHASAIATAASAPRTWNDYTPLGDLLGFPLAQYRYVWAGIVLIIGVIALFQLRVNVRKLEPVTTSDAPLFGGITALASIAGFIWFFQLTSSTHIQAWHFLPLLAVLAPLLDLVPLPRHRLARTIIFGLALATALTSVAFAHRDLKVRFSNLDMIASKLKAQSMANDYILITPWYCGITYNRYHHAAASWDTLPPITNHFVHHYDLVRPFMGDSNALATVEAKIAATLQKGGRVWIAGQSDLPSPERTRPDDLPAPPLKKTGWDDTPYNYIWSWQIGYYLTAHATNFGNINLPTNTFFNENENLTLAYAQGWRTNTP